MLPPGVADMAELLNSAAQALDSGRETTVRPLADLVHQDQQQREQACQRRLGDLLAELRCQLDVQRVTRFTADGVERSIWQIAVTAVP